MAAKHNTPSNPYKGKMSREQVTEMVRHGQSGAAGVHADQRAKRNGTGRTNRMGSRSAIRREAVRQYAY